WRRRLRLDERTQRATANEKKSMAKQRCGHDVGCILTHASDVTDPRRCRASCRLRPPRRAATLSAQARSFDPACRRSSVAPRDPSGVRRLLRLALERAHALVAAALVSRGTRAVARAGHRGALRRALHA